MHRAQASVELLAVLGISLLAVLILVLLATDALQDISVQQDYRQARESVRLLAEAADYVYAQGEGASRSVEVIIPFGTEYGPNFTYIGKPQSAQVGAVPNLINIRLKGSDIFASTTAPLAGAFPASPGTYLMNVTSHGNFVSIGSFFVSPSPDALYIGMQRNQSKALVLFIVAQQNATVVVNITSAWPYSSPSLSFHPSNFAAYGASRIPITLNVTSNSSVAGIYFSQLNVTAYKYGDSGAMETFTVPITVEVQVD